MFPFRKDIPKHRANRRVCKNYSSYKKTLRADFGKRCGYCNSLDINRIRSYVIDHFVPQTPDGWTHTIPPNEYTNLIYACSFCNGAKSNKWPTRIANKPNNGIVGFVKPTLKSYSKLFRRSIDGSIIVFKNNTIGAYIYKELDFNLDIRALNWKFEKILEQEEADSKKEMFAATLKAMNEPLLNKLNTTV